MTASGLQVPNYPDVSAKAAVVAHAAGAALAVGDMSKNHTNTGAAAAISLTLPAAADVPGCAFRVQVTAAFTDTLEPAGATEKIFLGGDGVANKHALVAGVVGNFAVLYSDGEDWHVIDYSGVVTKEA